MLDKISPLTAVPLLSILAVLLVLPTIALNDVSGPVVYLTMAIGTVLSLLMYRFGTVELKRKTAAQRWFNLLIMVALAVIFMGVMLVKDVAFLHPARLPLAVASAAWVGAYLSNFILSAFVLFYLIITGKG